MPYSKQATPTTLKFDPTSATGATVSSLYTPAAMAATGQGSRSIGANQSGGSGSGYNGLPTQTKFDSTNLLQPLMTSGVSASSLKLPIGNGGMQLSEVGPIRHRQSRPASERPSPVAFDGKKGRKRERERVREGERGVRVELKVQSTVCEIHSFIWFFLYFQRLKRLYVKQYRDTLRLTRGLPLLMPV